MLQEHVGAAKKVEVINAGVNAWSYAQMHTHFRNYGLKYEPDIVILGAMNKLSILKEFWSLLRVRTKFWLVPIVFFLLLLGAILVIGQGSALAPFIYSLFSLPTNDTRNLPKRLIGKLSLNSINARRTTRPSAGSRFFAGVSLATFRTFCQ
jgi:hypothetical protein